jgi:hypothetical protein
MHCQLVFKVAGGDALIVLHYCFHAPKMTRMYIVLCPPIFPLDLIIIEFTRKRLCCIDLSYSARLRCEVIVGGAKTAKFPPETNAQGRSGPDRRRDRTNSAGNGKLHCIGNFLQLQEARPAADGGACTRLNRPRQPFSLFVMKRATFASLQLQNWGR